MDFDSFSSMELLPVPGSRERGEGRMRVSDFEIFMHTLIDLEDAFIRSDLTQWAELVLDISDMGREMQRYTASIVFPRGLLHGTKGQ